MTFESCGYYMFHPLAAGRIAEELPHVRVIVLLRDPVDRAYSAHRHELNRGFETLDFDEALEREEGRLRGEEQRLVEDPTAYSFEHQHHAYLARSRYVEQVRRLFDTFGRDRVMVMDAEALFADPQGEFARLCDWLAIDPPVAVARRAVERPASGPALAGETSRADRLLRPVRRGAGDADRPAAQLARPGPAPRIIVTSRSVARPSS